MSLAQFLARLVRPSYSWEGAWLTGPRVVWMPADRSWHDNVRIEPELCVWHYTATAYGTARSMGAVRLRPRSEARPDLRERPSSWHFTVGAGLGPRALIVQHIAADRDAWHAGGGDRIPGANRRSIGVEIEGYGDAAPGMIEAVVELRRAIEALRPGIRHVAHSEVKSSKPDPGASWMAVIRGE